jgi:hypothetical protein
MLAEPPESQARLVLRRYRDHTCYVEVDDLGVVEDADDPESLQKLLGPRL